MMPYQNSDPIRTMCDTFSHSFGLMSGIGLGTGLLDQPSTLGSKTARTGNSYRCNYVSSSVFLCILFTLTATPGIEVVRCSFTSRVTGL